MERRSIGRTDRRIHGKTLFLFLWIVAGLVNLKAVFADFGPDQSYAIATSYRHLAGDRMFQEMWEPHQTSGFVSDLGMWLFHGITHSYDGVALFMQVYGVVLYALVTFALYKVLKKYLAEELVQLCCLFFFTARAKLMVYPEFSNMHIAFSVLLFLCLVEFLEENRLRHLLLAAGCMCLLVLSYPSCVINCLGVIACLLLYAPQKWKSVFVFAGSCLAAGMVYAGYFACKIGAGSFFANLCSIFTSDVSHTGATAPLSTVLRGVVYGIVWVLVITLVSLVICRYKRADFFAVWLVFALLSDVALLYIAEQFHVDWTAIFFILHICVMGVGGRNAGRLDERERRMWIMSIVLSVCSAVSVWLLTNQELLSVCAYMILGTMISFVPISKGYGKETASEGRYYGPIVLFCLLVMIHRGVAIYGYLNVEGKYVITDVENIVRVGPTKGIVTSLGECNEARYGILDWQSFTKEGENVLMVEESWYDPIVYLYHDSSVAAYSTINTAVYDESLEKYWEKYGAKRPEIIAVKAWDGYEDRTDSGWIEGFLDAYYQKEPAVGTYWHFYYKK